MEYDGLETIPSPGNFALVSLVSYKIPIYFFNLESLLTDLEEIENRGYFVVAVTSNSSRQKQYNQSRL